MEKLDINLDADFKNIDTNLTSSISDTIGIDLLIKRVVVLPNPIRGIIRMVVSQMM